MDRIEDLEEKLNSHILFIYSNLRLKDATIGPPMVKEIYKEIELMNKYDTITILLHSKGGNLATGYRIMKLIKDKFPNVNAAVIERSCSTGTFMALASDKLYVSPFALISPAEPQMELFDEYSTSVSTSLIKNALLNDIKNVNPYDIANYISTLKYFKRLCLELYGEEKGLKIFDYMHREVDSHQMPLTVKELNKLIPTEYIDNRVLDILREEHEDILKLLKSCKDDERYTVLKSKDMCLVEQKKFEDGKKVIDGYIEFYGKEDDKMKDNPRIRKILRERSSNAQGEYADAHQWNDQYDDEPQWNDQYDDEPQWNDQYDDEAVVDEREKKVKKNKRINVVLNEKSNPERDYKDAWDDTWDDSWDDSWDDTWDDVVDDGMIKESSKVKKNKRVNEVLSEKSNIERDYKDAWGDTWDDSHSDSHSDSWDDTVDDGLVEDRPKVKSLKKSTK